MKTSFWTKLFDVIAPRTCIVCGNRLSADESMICAVCHLHLPLTRYQSKATDNPMARLFWGKIPVEKAAALFFYEPQAEYSRIIYDMKYHGHRETCQLMGEMTARLFSKESFFDGIEMLIPVPLTLRRRWQRGYNQSLEIARGVSKTTGIPVCKNAIRRIRFKESQTRRHASERLQNVEHAFQLADGAEQIAGRHVLLIDDIVTTGATMTACGQELAKIAGVKISVLSLGLTKT